jgi:prevent-host-death family protein
MDQQYDQIHGPDKRTMKTVTISEAKAKLSALVEAAERGEEILIMRGSKPAVTLTPVSETDLVIWPGIPAAALADFDREIEADRKAGELTSLGRPATAAKALKR